MIAVQGKREELLYWILGFYLCLFVLTALGIGVIVFQRGERNVGALKEEEEGKGAAGDNSTWIHAFDRTTVLFAEWSFIASTSLTAMLLIAAWYGVIPGQKPIRLAYKEKTVPVHVAHVSQKVPFNISFQDSSLLQDAKRMENWILWLSDGVCVSKQTKFLWIEQVEPFDRQYESFKAKLTFGTEHSEFEAAAFLRKNDDSGRHRPVYRQIMMDPIEKNGAPANGDTFTVTRPDPGERIILIVKLDAEAPTCLPTKTKDFDVCVENVEVSKEPDDESSSR